MTSISQVKFLPVIVRLASGPTYLARIPGKGIRCTCTQGHDNAALALKGKYYPEATLYRIGEPKPKLFRKTLITPLPSRTKEEKALYAELSAMGLTHVIVP